MGLVLKEKSVHLALDLDPLAVDACQGTSKGLASALVKLLLDNLPPGLESQRQTLARCLEAMNQALPLRAVYLFGSHARREARPDSDVDLCIVADGADRQLEAARRFRQAMGEVWPCPSFTLIPISPQRLAEKRAMGDHFFLTVLKEGVLLAAEN